MGDCICVQSEWSDDRTTILNTFQIDRSCPVHGDAAWDKADAGDARWRAFTDEEMHRLGQDVRGDCDLTADIDAECKRRGIDTR